MGLSYSSHSEGKLDESDLMNTNTDSTQLGKFPAVSETTAEQSRCSSEEGTLFGVAVDV